MPRPDPLSSLSPEAISEIPPETLAAEIAAHEGVRVMANGDDLFFVYDPRHDLEGAELMPFATLIRNDDAYDSYSELSRPGIFRLNICLGKAEYEARFGPRPARDLPPQDWGYDFSALNTLMPHPVYARNYWVCILNPTAAAIETLTADIERAYMDRRTVIDRRHDRK